MRRPAVRQREMVMMFDYRYWVTRRLLDATGRLPPAAFLAPTAVATRDLRATLVHELDVEWSWRLNLQGRHDEDEAELRPEDYPDLATLRAHWARDEAEMRGWLGGLTDEALAAPATSANGGDPRPLWQFLVHVLTHAAQQQADAATLLSLAGATPGDLDFLDFVQDATGMG